ncbi:MAG TPA: hypothetical protein VLA91_07585 [Acidimicrobiia bacterium]|nr:hypothetical protein [Acidimicrobiia bacterium]
MRRLLALALLVVVGCSAETTAENHYALSEWAIDGPSRLSAADITLSVENTGDFRHTLLVTSVSGEVVGATGVIDSGSQATLELDLTAGTYSISCRIVTQDDEGNLSDHYQRGMFRTVTVGGA